MQAKLFVNWPQVYHFVGYKFKAVLAPNLCVHFMLKNNMLTLYITHNTGMWRLL